MPDPQESLAIRAAVGSDWSVLRALAAEGEPERRRVLRSHREAGFRSEGDAELVRLRRRLDEALDRVMLIELGIEVGLLTDADLPPGEDLRTLVKSSAFARYLTSYLYFGVQFVALRLLGPSSLELSPDVEERLNETPTPLPCPPTLELEPATAAGYVDGWLRSRGRPETAEDIDAALDFLDDIVTIPGEQAEYELWLRGLSSYPSDDLHFQRLTRGLLAFARGKRTFYADLEGTDGLDAWRDLAFDRDAWTARHPLTSRFGILDLYWLARLLRAEVSFTGTVSYGHDSWLSLLAAREPEGSAEAHSIADVEEVLRAVFDFTCDLVQNAVEIANDVFERSANPDAFPTWPPETICWRSAYDEELEEITRQRKERRFDYTTHFSARTNGDAPGNAARPTWSRRVRTGEYVEHLVGVALSGGGIRSATFNLGVLQRLQELDLLREIDYLSTVSGGGYIGAWLLGNVRRTHYWLSQLTDWTPSIAHLRRFSNYLAPRSGLMSADTWSMWGSWVRNAMLMQVTTAVWFALLLVGTRMVKWVFASDVFDRLAVHPANLVLGLTLTVLTVSICRNLHRPTRSSKEWHVLVLAVAPAWIGSFLTAAMLWAIKDRGDFALGTLPNYYLAQALLALQSANTYSAVLLSAWRVWSGPLVLLFGSFTAVSWLSVDAKVVDGSKLVRALIALGASLTALAAAYLGLCGVYWLFAQWVQLDAGVWYAYAAGPPLVLFVMTAAVVLIIGLIGHDSPDWRREWWTRFGSWLGIYGVAFLVLSITSVFGPLITLWLFQDRWGSVEWGTILGWVATVFGGLLTGSSDRTSGHEKNMLNRLVGFFTAFAAFVFVVGAGLMAATGLHALLVNVWTNELPGGDYWTGLEAIYLWQYGVTFAVLLLLGLAFSWRFEINIFGLNQFYRNRLVRCYLGATRWRAGLRKPHKFTGFDEQDDLSMSEFRHSAWPDLPYRGPFPIVNCSLNLGGSSDLGVHTRHSASFVITPLRSGADRKRVGYAKSYGSQESFAGGVPLGQAISVSGAAASPNMGHNSSPLVAFLLTMFNVRLAWWFPNPGRLFWSATWLRFSLWYLVREMFASADEGNFFVNVSDGGHFENLGVYELVRRRCAVIIACDAECDPQLSFGSLGNVVRMCQTDFGARIDIDVESIRRQQETGASRAHCAVGRITYANGSIGYLIYVKSSITGDEDIGIEQYLSAHPEFPHESTGDQFFEEEQFEAYRRLGYHAAAMTFRDVKHEPSLVAMARKLVDLWSPAGVSGSVFVAQSESLDNLWERFRTTPKLFPLLKELTGSTQAPAVDELSEEELCVCLELMQQMENVFLALRLDDFWNHPDNRGWTVLFRTWAKSQRFRLAWQRSHGQFGIRFVYFCRQRLGL